MAAANKQTPRQRHVPQRTCVTCRQTDAKRGLLRVVRTTEGRVELDPTGKRNGRGAYLCHNPQCWDQALKRKSLERALRVDTLHPDDRAALVQAAERLTAEALAAAVVTSDHVSS